MEKKKVFKIIGSALLAVLVLVLFVGLALVPAFSPKALSDDDVGGSDVSTYADISSPIGVWLFNESLPLYGNNILQVADFYYLTSSGVVSSSLHQYMRLETLDDGSVRLYFSTSASGSGTYVYDTTSGWVNDNFRYISVVSNYEYPNFAFLAAGATKLSDDPYYGPFQPDTPEPPVPDPDPGDGSYDEGYDDGYNAGYDDGLQAGIEQGYDDGYDVGYDEGYLDGFDDGVLDDLKNPLVFFVQPIASFLDTPLFAGVSIGDMLALLIFIFVALIFLRMFAGG